MPLRAQFDGIDVHAWEYSPREWDVFKQTYRRGSLRTTCCGELAIPKTSKLGTAFFAHSRRGECTSGPETHEHLLAKSLIARAAREAGWQVTTEWRGSTPDGETWIADVYAERDTPKGRQRVAFEVQWSAQTHADTVARQERYAHSGVRGLWLMRRPPAALDGRDAHQTPIFTLEFDPPTFRVQPFGTSLPTFVQGVLNSRLLYWPRKPGPALLGVSTVPIPCWRCRQDTQLIVEVHFRHPTREGASFSVPWNADSAVGRGGWGSAAVQKLLARILVGPERQALGVGVIKPRRSRTAQDTYLSQGCRHCDALQGDHFIMEHLMQALHDGILQPPRTWWPVTLAGELLPDEGEWFFLPGASDTGE